MDRRYADGVDLAKIGTQQHHIGEFRVAQLCLDVRLELVERLPIEDDRCLWLSQQWRGNRLVCDYHSAVGRSTALLWTVRGQPRDFFAFLHACACQKFANKHDTLSTKSCNDDVVLHHSTPSTNLNSPSGKYGITSLRTRSIDSTGVSFQLVGQVDRHSTSENPIPRT